jgi:hypothetical protein
MDKLLFWLPDKEAVPGTRDWVCVFDVSLGIDVGSGDANEVAAPLEMFVVVLEANEEAAEKLLLMPPAK